MERCIMERLVMERSIVERCIKECLVVERSIVERCVKERLIMERFIMERCIMERLVVASPFAEVLRFIIVSFIIVDFIVLMCIPNAASSRGRNVLSFFHCTYSVHLRQSPSPAGLTRNPPRSLSTESTLK